MEEKTEVAPPSRLSLSEEDGAFLIGLAQKSIEKLEGLWREVGSSILSAPVGKKGSGRVLLAVAAVAPLCASQRERFCH